MLTSPALWVVSLHDVEHNIDEKPSTTTAARGNLPSPFLTFKFTGQEKFIYLLKGIASPQSRPVVTMVRNFGEMAITCRFDIYVFGLCRTFKLEMTHEK